MFEGYITGVAPFGMFVELIEHYVEGMVHVTHDGGRLLPLPRADAFLFGENTKKTYRLGDRVRVQIVRVDMERRQIDLGLEDVLEKVRRERALARPAAQLLAAEEGAAQGHAGGAPQAQAAPRQECTQAPDMNIVVGTAGHIDHGKSSLVRALTGIDPDRLKEEKARGITIELGFAHTTIGDTRVAFVDVPGHERFVRTMLAGVGGIDCVLLIVAADESVMPQTREHFDICRLLRIPRGIIVLTKSDLADADTRALVRQDVAALVKGSFLESADVVEVSATTGDGLDRLRELLVAQAGHADARPVDGAARLPIDRAFSMKGFGTVVTGTLVSGKIAVDDELVVQPGDRKVKVRGVQVHGRAATEGGCGAAHRDQPRRSGSR